MQVNYQTESDIKPNKVLIENILNGKCDIVFNDDIKESEENTDQLYILINIDHPFFRPYSNQDDFKIVIEKFVISFVVAEYTAKMNSDKDGYILYKSIRDKMNEYLISMGE